MAKTKTIQQKQIEQTIKEGLNELGRKVIVIASRNSKISNLQKNHLRDSGNWRVKPYDTLTVSQFHYGKYNTPKGQATPKDRSNLKNTPLENAIDDFVPEATKVIIKNITDLLVTPIVKK